MKIAFIINDFKTERASYTTQFLALTAHKRNHTVYVFGVGDLGYSADGHMIAHARSPENKVFKTTDTFFKSLVDATPVTISSGNLDVLMLRNDPSSSCTPGE